jgi:hypothetical protein
MNKGESHGVHRADCQRSDLRIVIRPIRSRRFQSANGSAAAPLKPVITHYKRRGTGNTMVQKINWKIIGLVVGAVAFIATCTKVLADCNTYASATEDGAQNSCDSNENTPGGNSSCQYWVTAGLPVFCRDTTAQTECYGPVINSLTGQPLVYENVTIWVYQGFCVNGTCNYNASVGGTELEDPLETMQGKGTRPCNGE